MLRNRITAVLGGTKVADFYWQIRSLQNEITGEVKFEEVDGVYKASKGDWEWHVPDKSLSAVHFCYHFKETHERFSKVLEAGDTVIEVGTATGEFTVQAAEKVGPDGTVIAFEAQPDNFVAAKKNIELYGISNTTINHKAVSSQQGQMELGIGSVAGHSFHFDDGKKWSSDDTISVETITIDEYWDDSDGPIDLFKLTINGHELEAIKGASETLPSIKYISIPDNYTEVIEWLDARGFSVVEKGNPKRDPSSQTPVLLKNKAFE